MILANRVPAPARVGAIAPVDVIVPAGPTGCDPGQTSFFQVYICTYIYIYLYGYTYVYACTCIMYIYTIIRVYSYIYIYLNIFMYIDIFLCFL